MTATATGVDADGAAADARRSLVRWFVRPGWLLVGTLTAVFAAGVVPSLPLTWRLVPLAASAVLFGMPHGAVDHLALPRARGETPTRRAALRVGALYAVLGGVYAAVWVLAPVTAAVGFLVLTWVHWGQGDRHALTLFDGDHPRGAAATALVVAVRGGLPMVVPLVAFPAVYRRVLDWFVGPFGASTAAVAWLFAPTTRLALGAGLAVLTAASLAVGYVRAGTARAWLVDAGETLGLWAYFLAVPPLVSVGLYFSLWHSLRHVGRLTATAPAADALSTGRPGAALARFAREAAPLTVVALALVGTAALLLPVSGPELAGVYLVVVAVLTLPHAVVVTGMDVAGG